MINKIRRSYRPRLLRQLLLLGFAGAFYLACGADSDAGQPSHLDQCADIGLSICPKPFDANLPLAKDMLTWDQQTRVIGFRNTYRLYPGDVIHTLAAKAYPLPAAAYPLPPIRYEMEGHRYDLSAYLRRQSVTGLLVLKNGQVAYEHYGSGNTRSTLWTSRSVAKSVVSVLIGMAVKEGLIHSLSDPIIDYLPELKSTAWEGVTLKDLLQHTSGVAWNENYADPSSDFSTLTQCEAGSSAYPCVLQLVRSVNRQPGVRPGEAWSYNTGGAWLVGRVLEVASHMTIAHYLETRLWSRFAMESDGVWEALARGEVDMGGHGFNATLRDWGRFALFVADGGRLANGEQLLPSDWILQSTNWSKAKGSVLPATPQGQFGYQWWFNGVDPRLPGGNTARRAAQTTFWAEGIYGQAIAISPIDHLVMVQWSTWKAADTPDSLYEEQALFFGALVQALHRGGMARAAQAQGRDDAGQMQ
jgi:CubicO group peptidase (beta-lactamase class C family)